jgi:uncharacterized membrane protein YtjA (UPF0391 family)
LHGAVLKFKDILIENGVARHRLMIKEERIYMLGYTLIFLIIALIAGVLGFTGIAGAAVGIARILFAIFLILFLATLVLRLVNGG